MKTETRIIRIGETVVLTCTVHDAEVIDPGETRQWSKGSSLFFYNGRPTIPMKYMESLKRNQFQLLIYNVTEADLNSEYECLYGFDTYSKTLNITEENFEYPPTANNTELEYNYARNGNLRVDLYMKKVFPLPNCTILIEVRLTYVIHMADPDDFSSELAFIFLVVLGTLAALVAAVVTAVVCCVCVSRRQKKKRHSKGSSKNEDNPREEETVLE
ncbi:unnamed protein product [Mytilus coruscus]|uniref:Ig-like domain-containing protein n=1 Tax=Mytilus coruscus TaxID=42192 RepID=A0A6J8DZH1_MYTCO|nr:unnamed protein product [Mytilus coruscus]